MHKLIRALEHLEAAPLGNARLTVLQANDSPELRELLNYAMSPDITFGIKQLPDPFQIDVWEDTHWWENLKDLLDKLADRRLSGNEAKDKVGAFLGAYANPARKWTERILLQDLRLGIGVRAVNKILPGTIAHFKIPLAKPFKELKSLEGAWAVQPKMDGGRVVARWNRKKKKITLLSRSGKEWETFDVIKDALMPVFKDFVNDMTIDGEVVIYKNGRMDFNAMQRMFHAKDGRKPTGDMCYVMFDMATTEEYDDPRIDYQTRLQHLRDWVTPRISNIPNLKIIDSAEMVNPSQVVLDKIAADYVEGLGCDGAIIRKLDKVPTNKKTSDITKIKPFEDGEGLIIDKIEGKGWLEGSLGTLVCKLMINGKPTGPQFEIGTGEGLDKKLRQELWDDPNTVGSIVNFKYLHLSNDGVPVSTTYRAIRHINDM